MLVLFFSTKGHAKMNKGINFFFSPKFVEHLTFSRSYGLFTQHANLNHGMNDTSSLTYSLQEKKCLMLY